MLCVESSLEPNEEITAITTITIIIQNHHFLYIGFFFFLGGKFSKEAAKYAIEHIDADWNYNALQTAKTYQDQMAMSPAAIHDQLTSSYGGKFTKKQADYAIAHLDD